MIEVGGREWELTTEAGSASSKVGRSSTEDGAPCSPSLARRLLPAKSVLGNVAIYHLLAVGIKASRRGSELTRLRSGSVQIWLQFSMGSVAGPLFDKGYFRELLGVGSVLYIFW